MVIFSCLDIADASEASIPDVEHDISRLCKMFHALCESLLEYLKREGALAEEMQGHILFLPMLEPSLPADDPAKKEMQAGDLNARWWSFMDYHLLEHIAGKFGNEAHMMSIVQYVQDLQRFESHATVYDLIECWPLEGQDVIPKGFNTITLKIAGDPTCYTVAELNFFRQALSTRLWPHLKEQAKLVLVYGKHAAFLRQKEMKGELCLPSEHGDASLESGAHLAKRDGEEGGEESFVVVWVFPATLTENLEAVIREPKMDIFLEENSVQSIYIQDRHIFEAHKHSSYGSSDSGLTLYF